MKRLAAPVLMVLALSFGGCGDQGGAEKVGREIDEAVEDTLEAGEDAAEAVEEAAEDAEEKTRKAVN